MRVFQVQAMLLAYLMAGGCAALPVSTAEHLGDTETPGERVAAKSAVPVEFAHSGRRMFPDQGWWCRDFEDWLSPERAEHGYAIVLPGVEGTSFHNISIARGLIDAEFPGAVEVRDWTTGRWPMFPYHLMGLERNRQVARDIATQIVAYQDEYPGRPVSIIGHSGGAAMAVLVLESLPEGRQITQAVLLAAAISPEHDLTSALARTELGITSFHSWRDVPHLVIGTLALGTVDRQHTISAGAGGFHVPAEATAETRELYSAKLHQVPYRAEMIKSFHPGGHTGATNRKFVSEWVAPLVASREPVNSEK